MLAATAYNDHALTCSAFGGTSRGATDATGHACLMGAGLADAPTRHWTYFPILIEVRGMEPLAED